MKTIIIYGSKNGTTEKCALKLKEKLEDARVVNILKEEFNLDNYDNIIIGSAVRMGALMKPISKLLSDEKDIIMNKNLGIFLCNGFVEKTEEVINANISPDIINHASRIISFGGEININKLKGFDKFITKMVGKNTDYGKVKILDENIEVFASKFK